MPWRRAAGGASPHRVVGPGLVLRSCGEMAAYPAEAWSFGKEARAARPSGEAAGSSK